ncbi:ANKFN1 family protein [Megaselia abdita]
MDFNRFNVNRRSFKIMKNISSKVKKMENSNDDFFKASVPVALPQNIPYKACQILHIPLNGLNIQQDLIQGSGKRIPRVVMKNKVDKDRLEFCTIRKPRIGIVQRSSSVNARQSSEKMSSHSDLIQKSQNIPNVEPQSIQEKIPLKARNKVMSFNMDFFHTSENLKNKENRENIPIEKGKRHSANDCNIDISDLHHLHKSKKVQIQEKNTIHLHALFTAVEQGHLDKAKTILESNVDVNVNSLNSDGLTPLDIAVLSNNRLMTKMLLRHGAKENTERKYSNHLGNHLKTLFQEAELKIYNLSSTEDLMRQSENSRASISSIIIGNTSSSVSGCTGSEADKQIGLWERRLKGIRRMIQGWEFTNVPNALRNFKICVTNVTSVSIALLEPNDGPIVTKFKVQWSAKSDFTNLVGEKVITEWNSAYGTLFDLHDLTQGRQYFFRACGGNFKGWGPFLTSMPSCVIPSSWRDTNDNREHRFLGRQRVLDDLLTKIMLSRETFLPEIVTEFKEYSQLRNIKKKTIKQLFTATTKFQKTLRRGIYLSCVIHYEDKVLVTNEEFVPVIEIDDTYPNNLNSEFQWLIKVVQCTCEDLKSFRASLERNSSSATQFRLKVLNALLQMQSVLGLADLGQFYHKLLRDPQGTIVISFSKGVNNTKYISALNTKWIPLNKIQKRINSLNGIDSISDILLNSIPEQIFFSKVSSAKLSKGLYLGYLKMVSSVDKIEIIVPVNSPNVLPHCKIRENPHINSEEWKVLFKDKGVKTNCFLPQTNELNSLSDEQSLFLNSLLMSTKKLFANLNLPFDEVFNHRIYNSEVIELSADVSFLIILPPSEKTCSVPGGDEEKLLSGKDLIKLPIPIFEMIYLKTFYFSIMQKYCRISCILDIETLLAQHCHREAFSNKELITAKDKLSKLNDFSTNLNDIWKRMRWLTDVISYARNYSPLHITFKEVEILQKYGNRNIHLLQLPSTSNVDNSKIKQNSGRGSWPGPTVENSEYHLKIEYSKSEQNIINRKHSADVSGSYSMGETNQNQMKMPPSVSDNQISIQCSHPEDMASANKSKSSSHLEVKVHDDFRKPTDDFKKPKPRPIPKSLAFIERKYQSGPPSPNFDPPFMKLKYHSDEDVSLTENENGIIHVFAAYDTGLADGTSLKLHVTSKTTAREVTDLVVKQLNMAVVLKGKSAPIYEKEKLNEFCLVAVIGARERCLRDDFRPLQLQNPWRKGKLYVRQKHDLLAAINHFSNKFGENTHGQLI